MEQSQVLSRDELAVLLDSLEEGRQEAEQCLRLVQMAQQNASGSHLAEAQSQRGLERFCARQSQRLSSQHQTRITVALLDLEELELADLAERVPEGESIVLFGTEATGPPGVILLSRSLFFSWLLLLFGSRPGRPPSSLPTRPYTAIERRFLHRFGNEVVAALRDCVPELVAQGAKAGAVERAGVLWEHPNAPVLLASFQITGLGELGRLRVAIPLEGGPRAEAPESSVEGTPQLLLNVLDTRVSLDAELGSTSLPLSRLAALRIGNTIPIEAAEDGKLAIRVEGAHLFDAVRGTVGNCVAVRIVDRVPGSGG